MFRLYVACMFGGQGVLIAASRLLVAFLVPLALGIVSYQGQWKVEEGLPGIIIAAFSIFSAMLFASQVAAFSVFSYKMLEAKPEDNGDEIIVAVNAERYSLRASDLRGAFRRINAGISVLTLVAVSITALTLAMVASPPARIEQVLVGAVTVLAGHFIVSFVLTCFHVFYLFDSAYLGEGS